MRSDLCEWRRTELREIAEQTPDLAVELRRIADELEAEVADLESS